MFTACKKSQDPLPQIDTSLPDEIERNNLSDMPGMIYHEGARSTIHWQPWDKGIFDTAKNSNRLIFGYVAMAQSPGFAETLNALSSDPGIVDRINQRYLPTLIDVDASREIGLLASELCAELNLNVSFPMFLWLSNDGHPIAWITVPWENQTTTLDTFRKSDEKVTRVWLEAPEYVNRNSSTHGANRSARMQQRNAALQACENSELDALNAIRLLISLYDPGSRQYNEIGGLFPIGILDVLASVSLMQDMPPDIERRGKQTLANLSQDLLFSAMFDPIDGGLFSARQRESWALPRHHRHALMQSRAAHALFQVYHSNACTEARDRALMMVRFSENHYQTPDDLFALGNNPSTDSTKWLWTEDQLHAALGTETAEWIANLMDFKSFGNIPYEIDTKRNFFGLNTIAIGAPIPQLARSSGMDVVAFQSKFDAAREMMADARRQRVGEITRDPHSHALATFRMISCYAAAYTASGDESWKTKAIDLLGRARQAFFRDSKLTIYAVDAPAPINGARAFHYVAAIQAILDVIQITNDTEWFSWSDVLIAQLSESFIKDGVLREASEEASVLDLPFSDNFMLFEESTIGTLRLISSTLKTYGKSLTPELHELVDDLPVSIALRPLLHTDLIQSFLIESFAPTVIFDATTSAELMARIHQLPIRLIQRRPAKAGEAIPANSCLVLRPNQDPLVIHQPGELDHALFAHSQDNPNP